MIHIGNEALPWLSIRRLIGELCFFIWEDKTDDRSRVLRKSSCYKPRNCREAGLFLTEYKRVHNLSNITWIVNRAELPFLYYIYNRLFKNGVIHC